MPHRLGTRTAGRDLGLGRLRQRLLGGSSTTAASVACGTTGDRGRGAPRSPASITRPRADRNGTKDHEERASLVRLRVHADRCGVLMAAEKCTNGAEAIHGSDVREAAKSVRKMAVRPGRVWIAGEPTMERARSVRCSHSPFFACSVGTMKPGALSVWLAASLASVALRGVRRERRRPPQARVERRPPSLAASPDVELRDAKSAVVNGQPVAFDGVAEGLAWPALAQAMKRSQVTARRSRSLPAATFR